ncbi:ribonuclease HII [Candidatus Bathyarchaeota archaeon]|nr:ribonuclease HII [Candidatus Bathyarchaeota archaeon]
MLVAGVDDAGRGSVIGPLVIAGILIDSGKLSLLEKLGVKDSKLLSPHKRESLAAEIKKLVDKWTIIKLSPTEIDRVVESGRKLHKLNRLEAQAMAKVIDELKPDVAYVDASDILEERFKQHIQECLHSKVKIVSEHKADKKYPVVSAASIIAKVERDREIEKLKAKYGDFGCGYPSDPRTKVFLHHCLEEMGEYPNFVRKSWKTVKNLKREEKSKQTKLF